MNTKGMKTAAAVAAVALAVTVAVAKTSSGAKGNTASTSEASVTTNDNGSVSRTFVESTVTTNGNMVTEHRRETRTNLDMAGNVLVTTTSEYDQSYPVGETPFALPAAGGETDAAARDVDSFLGLRFGEVFKGTNFVEDVTDADFVCTTFRPAKPLDGFDDYYVYVTPKTHRIAKVFACAREAVDPGTRWRRHYLLEALEKRYGTWARLCSFSRPHYAFDVGGGRHVTALLDGASRDYRTMIVAWDDEMSVAAADEREELREAARKSAAEKRNRRVDAAAAAF